MGVYSHSRINSEKNSASLSILYQGPTMKVTATILFALVAACTGSYMDFHYRDTALKVLEFLNKHPSQAFTGNDIANKLGMALDYTPTGWQNQKVQQSCYALLDGDWSYHAIGPMVQ